MALNAKQSRFAREYLIDLNATQAAIRAGYSKKTAGSQGFDLLKKPEIQEALVIIRQELSAQTGITPEKVVKEIGRLAFSDMRRLANWSSAGVSFLGSGELSEDDSACIQEVSETTTKDGGSVKIKLHSKTTALDALCRHFGLYDADQSQKNNVKFVVCGTPGKKLDECIAQHGSVEIGVDD